jgi:glycosyltransferase involved in cell wall biosynthesis
MVPSAISILVCTYNRAASLDRTLAAMAALRVPAGWPSELVIVDNNSTDQTQEVVARHRARFPFPVILGIESRQGKSFALNHGLRLASGSLLALTDDDVVPRSDWLERIAEAFDGGNANFVFGKVLPNWEREPPAQLLTTEAQQIWGPLALVDYGDDPEDYDAASFGKKRLPVGANLAFRRDALLRIGGWRNDLGKVNNSLISGEDHEIFHRLLRAGLFLGRYDPSIAVLHDVPASRLSARYFRRWFFWNGRTIARMLPDYYPEIDFAAAPRVGGAPRFLYRQAVEQWLSWVASLAGRRRPGPWVQELYAIRYIGVLVECWLQRLGRGTSPSLEKAARPAEIDDEAGRSTVRQTGVME